MGIASFFGLLPLALIKAGQDTDEEHGLIGPDEREERTSKASQALEAWGRPLLSKHAGACAVGPGVETSADVLSVGYGAARRLSAVQEIWELALTPCFGQLQSTTSTENICEVSWVDRTKICYGGPDQGKRNLFPRNAQE